MLLILNTKSGRIHRQIFKIVLFVEYAPTKWLDATKLHAQSVKILGAGCAGSPR